MKNIFLLLLSFTLLSCNEDSNNLSVQMPAKPDYRLSNMWYNSKNITTEYNPKSVDLFYVLPTAVFDWSDCCGVTYHYADVNSEEQRDLQLYSYMLADDIFGEDTNFYAPYYRQITLNVWMSGESAVDELFPAAMEDIDNAFDYFIENINEGRPFIIAGFSQGGKGVVELVKRLTSEELSRMVAAYVIGYKVTSDDMSNGNIVAATGEDDTGVTICYNSCETIDAINPMISATEISINPVNWRCDDVAVNLNDSVTVTLNTAYNILIVKGLNSDSLYYPELDQLFKIGNYHLQELELYKDCLRENVAVRVDNFLEKNCL